MRLWSLSIIVAGSLTVFHSAKALESVEVTQMPEGTDPDTKKFIEDKQKKNEELLAQRRELETQLAAKTKAMVDSRAELVKRGKGTVVLDEETREITEPGSMEEALGLEAGRKVRDAYELSPDDFKMVSHDRWTINPSDLKIDRPQYITKKLAEGKLKTWFVIPVWITNTTSKKRLISPTFTAVTSKGVFNQSSSGFMPERLMADSMLYPLAGSEALIDKELVTQRVTQLESSNALGTLSLDPEKGTQQLSPQATFEPGQTRLCLAVWSSFTDEFVELKVIIKGLCNTHRYQEKMQRVMILSFTRNDDEFDVDRTELKYQDKRFDFIWAWDQDISVPLPTDAKDPQLKIQQLATPSGSTKLAVAFPFVLKNTTRFPQSIAIQTVSLVVKEEIQVGDVKVPLDVRVVDDGFSSIYKAQLLKALTKESPKDRYLFKPVEEGSMTRVQRRTVTLEPAKELPETWAVFDEANIDWDNVRLQVETELTVKFDKKAASAANWDSIAKTIAPNDATLAQKNPGFMYDPRRRLTEEEFTQVKEQVSKGLAAAVDAAKSKKLIRAEFDCVSGLSSGVCRINRSYVKPGVVDEAWLTEWETWYKNYEADNMKDIK